jgi:hypothetical protein
VPYGTLAKRRVWDGHPFQVKDNKQIVRALPKEYSIECHKTRISCRIEAASPPFWTDHMAPFYNRCLFRLAMIPVLAAGCDVRDEVVHTPQSTHNRWPEPVTYRIDQNDTHLGDYGSARISFIENCDIGLRLADFANKPLLIVFRAAWCRWSMALTQQTLSDPSIVALTDSFICVQVDADRHAETCRQYNVTQFPTILIIDTEDNEIIRRSGHTMVADLTPLLQNALSSSQIATRHLPTDGNTAIVAKTEDTKPVTTTDTLHTAKSSTQKNAR